MTCRLVGTKPNGILLSGPLGTNFNKIWIKIHDFHSRKYIWKCRPENGSHFVWASMSSKLANSAPSFYLNELLMITSYGTTTGVIRPPAVNNEELPHHLLLVWPPLVNVPRLWPNEVHWWRGWLLRAAWRRLWAWQLWRASDARPSCHPVWPESGLLIPPSSSPW